MIPQMQYRMKIKQVQAEPIVQMGLNSTKKAMVSNAVTVVFLMSMELLLVKIVVNGLEKQTDSNI